MHFETMRRLWNTRSRTVRLKPARWWNKTHCVTEQLYGALCNYLHDIIVAFDIRSETRARPAYCILQRIRHTRSSLLRCSCQLTHIARSPHKALCTKGCSRMSAHGAWIICKIERSQFIWVIGHCISNAFDLTGRSNEPEIAKWIRNESAPSRQ